MSVSVWVGFVNVVSGRLYECVCVGVCKRVEIVVLKKYIISYRYMYY